MTTPQVKYLASHSQQTTKTDRFCLVSAASNHLVATRDSAPTNHEPRMLALRFIPRLAADLMTGFSVQLFSVQLFSVQSSFVQLLRSAPPLALLFSSLLLSSRLFSSLLFSSSGLLFCLALFCSALSFSCSIQLFFSALLFSSFV